MIIFFIKETKEIGEYDGRIGMFGDILDSSQKTMNPITGKSDKDLDVFLYVSIIFRSTKDDNKKWQ